MDCPLEDCTVRVHYTARLAGPDQVVCRVSCYCARQGCRGVVLNLLQEVL